ncbi:MFS transporter [Actinoplanes sp. TBRC 11911]|uniref:sugar efflux transporter n=1 Tax=Actinoplanes sp. TBRC 11911 TaxID=2729386 RepID=UPI00145F904B|nr:sugar efflux transporter [Actinoplanes sp. TBRC 11911]NMO57628.1 MFS transporter [Actinoplanes sp. TBRC 11911]
MAAPPVTPVRLTRRLFPLTLIFIAVGLSTSFVGPYLALFLNDAVHAGPVRTTVFLIAAPASGVVIAWVVGRLSDHRPIRRRLLLVAATAGLAGTALTAVVRDYWVLLAITVTLTAMAASLVPQSYAYARQVLQHGDPARAAMAISLLRTLLSAAWVGGPPVAALLLASRGFGLVYGFAALTYTVALGAVLFGLKEVPRPVGEDGAPLVEVAPAPRRTIYVIIAGFVSITVTMTLGVQAMPFYVSTDLGGSVRQAGLVLGLCALLEIPLLIAFGALAARVPLRRLILFGALVGIAYQTAATLATTVWMLAAAQVLNATFIATISGLGVSYVQDLMPGRPGRATTMITNTYPAGQILAGPAFGLAQHFGFRLAYGMNLGLCVVGLLLMIAAGRRASTARPEPVIAQLR